MGVGICGAIPLEITFDSSEDKEQYSERFDSENNFASVYESNGDDLKYKIDPSFLMRHFKSFYFDFHKLIKTDFEHITSFNDEYNKIIQSDEYEKFLSHFKDQADYDDPHYMTDRYMFSTTHARLDKYMLIYQGSYKAILEEYSTLKHMEYLLSKAINNPLAKTIKFGIFG